MTPSRSQVVHVFGVMDPGGAELRTIELMEAMSDRVTATYVTLSGQQGALTTRIEQSGGRVVPLRLGPRFPARFIHLLRDSGADVLHSHVQDFSGLLVNAARIAKVPVRISHYHSDGDGADETWRRRKYRTAMRRLVHAGSTAIVGVAPTTLDSVWGPQWRGDPAFVVIPNVVPVCPDPAHGAPTLRQQFGIPADAWLLGHVGRPSPEKNRGFLIPVLRELGTNAHLVYVGPEDPAADEALRQAAARAGVLDRIHFTGYRADVQNVMGQLDVLLLPSVREGLPGVVIEACIAGTPVVANELPGAAYIAEQFDGVTTIPLVGGAAQWADAVRTTMLRPRIGSREALQRFEQSEFQMSSSVPRWLRLYRAQVPSR